jgi:hypothetical protein
LGSDVKISIRKPSVNNFLLEDRFDFIADHDKDFILAFDDQMNQLGYGFGSSIGSGYCWGKYMIIYTKLGVKSKRVSARIYIREDCIVLRLFLNDIDNHREFLESAPAYIKDVFVGEQGICKHDREDEDGKCRFQKTYTLDGRQIEKCNGITFEFHDPSIQRLPDYLALLTEFYPRKRK